MNSRFSDPDLYEDMLHSIIDLCADAIISINQSQEITLFNQGAEEIFGYGADEILGQPLSVLLPPESRGSHGEHLRTFSQAENPSRRMGQRGEIYGMRKCGEVFPAEASISKQKISGDWIFTAVLRDVTEQRRVEEELTRANRELQRSNSDLENFAAVASHDLQEPLRKIQAFGERLESKFGQSLPERGQDYLGRMQNAAGRMSDLIQDLLEFSRVTTRAQPFEWISLGEIARRVCSDLEVQIERTRGRVDVGELPELAADPLQIRLLFQNLIGNGLKFHRQGVPPVVSVNAELREEDGLRVCDLIIEDNGVGFDEKYLDRIFEVFQRLHGRGVYEGTGMGLAIARKIVERHDGSITAKSEPEKGTKFIITLPVEQAAIHETETETETVKASNV